MAVGNIKKRSENDLSIIIPAFNEGEQIGMTIDGIICALKNEKFTYQIIVVDDGSADGTGLVSKEHGAHIVLETKKNRGRGAAIQLGLSKASGSVILTVGADGSYDPKDIKKMIKPILKGEADLVIGSEYLTTRQPLQMLGAKIISFFMLFFLEKRITNVWSGFKAYRDSLFHDLTKKELSSDLGFDSDTIILAKKLGSRIIEIPVSKRPRESFGYSRQTGVLKDALVMTAQVLRGLMKNG